MFTQAVCLTSIHFDANLSEQFEKIEPYSRKWRFLPGKLLSHPSHNRFVNSGNTYDTYIRSSKSCVSENRLHLYSAHRADPHVCKNQL